jgi:UDP:flavonoid glycosyltransferase YjiC (YdhE family)
MVAIPIGYDQPGVAARIKYHGVGECLELEDLTVQRLQRLIQEVLENSRYREKARWFQKVIAQTRGLDVAADVIERAFRLPVYPQSFRPNPSKLMADRRVVAHA